MIKISQSLINDLSNFECCSQAIKFKYVDKRQTAQTDAMFSGNYFEYYVLGDTRDHRVPIFTKVNRKNLKPTKSASKKLKIEYLTKKQVGFNLEASSEELDEILDTMPEDLTAGEPGADERGLVKLVEYAKNVMFLMGIIPSNGQNQVQIDTGDLIGHLDHVNQDFANPTRKAIYDLKYTETGENDRFNGWGDILQNFSAINQARHYIKIYHDKFKEFLPFYFLVFGKSGWVKVFKMNLTEDGLAAHESQIETVKEVVVKMEVDNFPATPKFNKCAKCDFKDICDFRATRPEVEEISL